MQNDNTPADPVVAPQGAVAGLVERLRKKAAYTDKAFDNHSLGDLFREAADALERLGGGGWQPIETAPRDGTPVLAYFGDTAGDDVSDFAVVMVHRGGWVLCEYPHELVDDPTHWQHFPAPPLTALKEPTDAK